MMSGDDTKKFKKYLTHVQPPRRQGRQENGFTSIYGESKQHWDRWGEATDEPPPNLAREDARPTTGTVPISM
jgi:hypothetical protein